MGQPPIPRMMCENYVMFMFVVVAAVADLIVVIAIANLCKHNPIDSHTEHQTPCKTNCITRIEHTSHNPPTQNPMATRQAIKQPPNCSLQKTNPNERNNSWSSSKRNQKTSNQKSSPKRPSINTPIFYLLTKTKA